MFIRRKHTPSGEVLQLVQAYRNAEGQPRQRILLSLGNAAIPEPLWPTIAKAVEDRLRGQTHIFASEISNRFLGRYHRPSPGGQNGPLCRLGSDRFSHSNQIDPARED